MYDGTSRVICFCELFKVKKCAKTRKVLKMTAKPKVIKNLKRSWKKS